MTEIPASRRSAAAVLGRPLVLPCGAILKNRIVKAAMSDSLGDGRGDPTAAQARLYERWAHGGAALSLIGEVQVDPRYPEKPGNLALTSESDQAAFAALTARGTADGAHLWPQLGHAGALAHAPVSDPKGPSALDLDGLVCGEMSVAEIEELPERYAAAARAALDLGFTGVQIHAGHGFLLSQFLTPLFNRRTDGYGGAIDARSRILLEIVDAVRRAVGSMVPIAVKLNSTDQLEGGLTPDDALEVVKRLGRASVDLVDVSGGTYFPGAPASSDSKASAGAYFEAFARRAKAVASVPILLTGGVVSSASAAAIVGSGAADAVGVGRGFVLDPNLANAWLSGAGGQISKPRFDAPPPGGITAWHTMRLTAIGEDREDAFEMTPQTALAEYDARDAARVEAWRRRYGS